MQQHEIVDELIALQVQRKFFISISNKQTNAAGALVRMMLGWQPDHPEAADIKQKALRIVADGIARKPYRDDEGEQFDGVLEMVAKGLEPFAKGRQKVELTMRKAVRQLSAAVWAKGVRGLGELALAVIIGEAGDLSRYANPGKLWKRLGLAPLDGHAMSTWRSKGGLTAEDWTKAGYSPRRRAEIYSCLGDPLFRQQTMIAGPYRLKYDARRARTAETHPDWSKGHSHNDALRIMTKQLISDLWSEWRRSKHDLNSKPDMTAADPILLMAAE